MLRRNLTSSTWVSMATQLQPLGWRYWIAPPPLRHTGKGKGGKGKSSARHHARCSQAGQGGNSSPAASSSISYHSPCCRWGYYLWTGTKRHAKRKDKAMPGLQPLLKGRESRTARLPILGCIRRTVVSLLHLLLCWYNQAKWRR